MDIEKMKALAALEISLGDPGIYEDRDSTIHTFLEAVYGRKRIILLKVKDSKSRVLKELNNYCREKNIEEVYLQGESLKPEDIKGETEIVFIEGTPYTKMKKPKYVSGKNQMIIVENINEAADEEMIKAFKYMASMCSCFNNLNNMPNDMLPYGSSYVFIAEKGFPFDKFNNNYETVVLDLREFQTRVKEHLSEYKAKKLKILSNGTYAYKGKNYVYNYILPKNMEKLNIIENYREAFFKSPYYEKEAFKDCTYHKIKLHMYFNHLNSSQSMCINFFYPLIHEASINLILDILGIQGKAVYDLDHISFEKESDLEQGNFTKTNFDFYIKLKNNIKVYFEIKYTEGEFGKTQNDEDHTDKFNEVYKTMLSNSKVIKQKYKTKEFFFSNYQIMRNIVHIDESGYVVFLYPKDNYGIRRQALGVRENVLEGQLKNHLILFTWENMLQQLITLLPSGELKNYYIDEFIYKYLKY